MLNTLVPSSLFIFFVSPGFIVCLQDLYFFGLSTLYTLLAHTAFLTPSLVAASAAIAAHEYDLVVEFLVTISSIIAMISREMVLRPFLGLSATYLSSESFEILGL